MKRCQGDHGRCRANYRCCLPALAGFVSPHSMGPGAGNKPQVTVMSKQFPRIVFALIFFYRSWAFVAVRSRSSPFVRCSQRVPGRPEKTLESCLKSGRDDRGDLQQFALDCGYSRDLRYLFCRQSYAFAIGAMSVER